MQSRSWILPGILSTILAIRVLAEERPASPTQPLSAREVNLALVKQMDATRLRDYGRRPEFFVRPGLLADRTGRVVRVCAESIRLKPGDPVEFPLITQGSGKDYEALATSFASALDLHRALEFIGLVPGRCIDPAHLQFWSKGDRVKVVFHYTDSNSTPPVSRHLPVERLVIDTRTAKPIPESGFIFTGSSWEPDSAGGTGKVYAAEAFSPGAIISLYNEASTVLDVPRRVGQNEVYTFQVPNPDYLLPSNALIEITLEPYFTDSKPHRRDLTLGVAPSATDATDTDLLYSLKGPRDEMLNTNRTANGFLAALERLGIEEVYVTVKPDASTPLASLKDMARLLNTLDHEKGIRVEAPPPGEPYFKAFLPNEKHRKREDRPAQAAELHLSLSSGTATGELVWVDSEWKGDDSAPVFRETRIPIASPAALSAALAAREEAPPVILIFAPGTLRYGMLGEFLSPILQRRMILYVFTL